MNDQLMLDSGPRKLRFIVLGAIALAFGLGIAIMMRPGQIVPPAKAKTAVAAGGNAAGASAGTHAAAPAADASVDAAAATPAPADATVAANDTGTATAPAVPGAVPPPNVPTGNTTAAAGAAPAAPAPAPADSSVAAARQDDATAAGAPAAVATAPAVAAPPAPATAPAVPAVNADAASDKATADSVATADDASGGASSGEASPVAAQHPEPRAAVRTPPPPALEALRPWWREEVAAQDFNVEYVGQAASEDALVFRFSDRLPSVDVAARQIRVTDAHGNPVSGTWAPGQNQYVAVYRGIAPGRYHVSIDADLKSASGAPLGTSLEGPVYVQ